ncbi:protein-tyrosine phosphatase-like protein [Mycena leptocephala]|nr:protein-tyrosine phosphatase-like protein [Mycena leptocephala]
MSARSGIQNQLEHLSYRQPQTSLPLWRGLQHHRQSLKRYEENELEAFVKDAKDTLEIGAPAYEAIFKHFLERPGEPCLFHCSAGKDRTGLIAALILMLLGVDDADITNDYALTAVGLEPAREKFVARMQNIPVYRDNAQGAINMGSSKEESMNAILAMIREKYGGAAGYLTAFTSLQERTWM